MYALFLGDWYYPSGGCSDLYDKYLTVEDAKVALMKTRWDWWQIVDLSLGKIVEEGHAQ